MTDAAAALTYSVTRQYVRGRFGPTSVYCVTGPGCHAAGNTGTGTGWVRTLCARLAGGAPHSITWDLR